METRAGSLIRLRLSGFRLAERAEKMVVLLRRADADADEALEARLLPRLDDDAARKQRQAEFRRVPADIDEEEVALRGGDPVAGGGKGRSHAFPFPKGGGDRPRQM